MADRAMPDAVIRMQSDGPEGAGLTFMGNCESEPVVAGNPVEIGHNYFTDSTAMMDAGVWECTAYTAEFDAYPVDEFCYMLSGSVTITMADGTAETFVAGDCFVVPKGLRCTWHMPETARKYYVIFDSGS